MAQIQDDFMKIDFGSSDSLTKNPGMHPRGGQDQRTTSFECSPWSQSAAPDRWTLRSHRSRHAALKRTKNTVCSRHNSVQLRIDEDSGSGILATCLIPVLRKAVSKIRADWDEHSPSFKRIVFVQIA
jgi:hypothetical protein